MKQLNQLFHARRRTADGSPFTKKVAEARRWDLVHFVLKAIPADELLALIEIPRPPSISELIKLAQERAAGIPWNCPHCNGPLPHLKATQGESR